MNRSHGSPACVEVATWPCTSNWNTDFAVAVHCSVRRSHAASPCRFAPSPQTSCRTKQTRVWSPSVRPVFLEIVQKRRPVRRQAMSLKILVRKGKAVVHAHDDGLWPGQLRHKPFRDALARPVLARAGRRRHFAGDGQPVRSIHAQRLQAGRGRFRSRVINPDVSLELRHRERMPSRKRFASRKPGKRRVISTRFGVRTRCVLPWAIFFRAFSP